MGVNLTPSVRFPLMQGEPKSVMVGDGETGHGELKIVKAQPLYLAEEGLVRRS